MNTVAQDYARRDDVAQQAAEDAEKAQRIVECYARDAKRRLLDGLTNGADKEAVDAIENGHGLGEWEQLPGILLDVVKAYRSGRLPKVEGLDLAPIKSLNDWLEKAFDSWAVDQAKWELSQEALS